MKNFDNQNLAPEAEAQDYKADILNDEQVEQVTGGVKLPVAYADDMLEDPTD